MRQPLIATCSMDRSVHLWNYVDRSCELTKTFSEEAYSIAIHPTGMQVRCAAPASPVLRTSSTLHMQQAKPSPTCNSYKHLSN